MRIIHVSPDELLSAAARLDESNQEYQRVFHQLFEAVEVMKGGWEGKDNITFTNQIMRLESDFRDMSVLCSQYSEFLKSSARSYRDIQDDLASQASALM